MLRIIAIGGGEIGRPGFPVETTKIDQEIVRLSGKKHPRLLFIPTASSDSQTYLDTVQKHFGQRLGCIITNLLLIKEKPSIKIIRSKILNTDIIYVGGGNTDKMLKIWRRYGIDKIIKQAYRKNIILSGLSAGAICWFKFGSTDSKSSDRSDSYTKLKGLGLVSLTLSPHHIREKKRSLNL